MKIGITIGDPAGIGPEIVLKTLEYLAQFKVYKKHKYVVTGTISDFLLTCGNTTKGRLNKIKNELELKFLPIECKMPNAFGKATAEGGNYSVEALRKMINLFSEDKIESIATAPIDKKSIKMAGIKEVDHTQIFKKLCNVPFVDTLFKTQNLYIYFYSKHIPFADISSAINQNDLFTCILRCITYNKWLGIEKKDRPFALAALNPHASDGNRFGNEETLILEPVIKRLKREGYCVAGPVPADSVFALAKQGIYSSVLSLYHDQGHIAAKTLDFHRTVSLSPGMPFLRTSVDHGTAMNIAGQNKASAISMIHAVKTAIKYGEIYKKNYQD